MRVIFALVVLLTPVMAWAGAWVRPAGGAWVQVGPSLFRGTEQVSQGGFEGRAIELYGELGLGAAVELSLSTRWVDHRLTMADGTRRTTGWGDVEALVDWAPVNGQSALSLRAGVRGSPYERASLAERAAGAVTRGPGGVDLLVGAGFGRGFSWGFGPGWAGVELLHRLRLGCACSAVDLRGEAGVFVWPWLGLAATAQWQPAYGRDAEVPADGPAPIPSAGGVGSKVFVRMGGGFGLVGSHDWMPSALNDGPGHRVALTLSWERVP